MSSIYIFSPSGAVRDRKAFSKGISILKSLGHDVHIDPSALSSSERFAGDDATRLLAIDRACDSACDVAMISRGGYGLTRLLPKMNYSKIKKAIRKGTKFIGFSDFTAFQLSVLSQTQEITWSGPSVMDDLAVEAPDDITLGCLEDVLSSQVEGAGWALKKSALQSFITSSGPKAAQASILAKDAVLWGGNLSVLCSLIGTPYFPDIKGGVLFLEDTAEHPYKIERMLTQLLNAGVLKNQKAILLGQFNRYALNSHDRGFNFSKVVSHLRTQIKTPVLTDLPFGHVPVKVCLPVGQRVSLTREGNEVFLLWPHEHL
jgi:muramoyltetrapeptide carboxypeptidase